MKFVAERNLFDKVKTVQGIEGTITLVGHDAAGAIYIVEWLDSNGTLQTKWVRDSEILL